MKSRTENSNLKRKPETEVVLAAILAKKQQKRSIMKLAPVSQKFADIRYRHGVVFDKSTTMNLKLKSKPKKKVVLSAVLTKNRRKRPKIAGNRSAFREFEASSNSGGLGDAPGRRSDSEYAECRLKAISRKRCKIRPRMTRNKNSGPPFGETVYIFEVNGARKVKSNAHVPTNKNSDPVQKYYT